MITALCAGIAIWQGHDAYRAFRNGDGRAACAYATAAACSAFGFALGVSS